MNLKCSYVLALLVLLKLVSAYPKNVHTHQPSHKGKFYLKNEESQFPLYDYCGAAVPTKETYPGPIEGYALKNVQVLARHGDRSPFKVFPNQDGVQWNCSLPKERSQISSNAGGTGFSVNVLVDVLEEKNLYQPYHVTGTCQSAQLTYKGHLQHVDFGSNVRDIYVDKLGFLPNMFEPEKVYLRSTNKHRTMQSAQSFIMGVYPEKARPHKAKLLVNIHTQLNEVDTMDIPAARCPRLEKLMQELYSSEEWVNHMSKHSKLRKELIHVLGTPLVKMDKLMPLADELHARVCHNKQLPCNRKTGTCATREMVEELFEVQQFEYMFENRDFNPLFPKLQVGVFLGEIVDYIDSVLSGEYNKKDIFRMYSGHDSTVIAVLGALKASDMRWPPYRSNIVFELWEPTAETGQARIRILYNGKVFGNEWCSSESGCDWEEVKQKALEYVPKDVVAECGWNQ